MKKIITFLAVCAIALCATSCLKQIPGLSIEPSVDVKVGEKVQLHPTLEGEEDDDLIFTNLRPINFEDGICVIDNGFCVTGLKPGTSRVGVGILNDKNDISKGFKYEAYTKVTVTE